MKVQLEEGDALPAVERTISQLDIDRYAEASGDFNPVHVDTGVRCELGVRLHHCPRHDGGVDGLSSADCLPSVAPGWRLAG